jgi:hypothetical protein
MAKFFRGVELGETIQPPGPKVRRHRNDTFVMMWRDQIVAIAKAFETPQVVVVWMILYEHWVNKGRPFTLSNAKLTACGVSRFAKGRALANLEAAGLIAIDQKPGRAPVISWKGPCHNLSGGDTGT